MSSSDSELGPIGIEAGRSVLDLGCGSARLAREAAEQGCRAVGLDSDERSLRAAAAASGSTGAMFVRGDIVRLPFATESFDIVGCSIALYYAPIAQGLVEIARVLRPGGRAYATIPLLTAGRLARDARRGGRSLAYGLAHAVNGVWLLATGRQLRNPLMRRDGWALYARPRSLKRLVRGSPLSLDHSEFLRRERSIVTMRLSLTKPDG